jgi:hypothetical protein
MKFREDRLFAGVDAAVKKLMEIANGLEPDHAGRIHIGPINKLFMDAGGDPAEYSAAVKAAIDRGYPPGRCLSWVNSGHGDKLAKEPSTASQADSCTAANIASFDHLLGPG